MEIKIKQQTVIYSICCSILCLKNVAANRKIGCLMLDFSIEFRSTKGKKAVC